MSSQFVVGKVIFAAADYDLLFKFYLLAVGFIFIAFIIKTDFFIENDNKTINGLQKQTTTSSNETPLFEASTISENTEGDFTTNGTGST